MVAEALDQHHGGLGRLVDDRNGLTAPNIFRLGGDLKETNSTYCFGGFFPRSPRTPNLPLFLVGWNAPSDKDNERDK